MSGRTVTRMNHEPTQLRVSVSRSIDVSGELDALTTPQLAEAVRSMPPGPRRIDASGVTFVGSSGLSLLVQLQDECARAGEELSIRSSAALRRIAEVAGLTDVLPLS